MTRIITFVSLSVLLLVSVAAVAQEGPRAEVFGGYQLTHATTGVSGVDSFSLNGWDAAATAYVNRYLGVTSDFSGTYGSPSVAGVTANTHLYTYMFGPTIRATNSSAFTPFAHVLFGGAHLSASGNAFGSSFSGSDSGFAWAGGGGVDFKVSPFFSIRAAQFDFLQSHIGGDSQNNFRYSGGAVLHF